jgi:hypothetical protein
LYTGADPPAIPALSQSAVPAERNTPPSARTGTDWVVLSKGEFDVRGTWFGDLDAGAETLDDAADFKWAQYTDTTRALEPFGKALFARAPSADPGPSVSAAADLSSKPIDGSDPEYGLLPPGTWLCAFTDEFRTSAFQIVSHDTAANHMMTLTYPTWGEGDRGPSARQRERPEGRQEPDSARPTVAGA